MTKPSKAAAVFLVMFGMVFAGAGLFFAWALTFGPPGAVHGDRAVGVVLSLFFVAVGGVVAFSAVYGIRKLGEQAALAQSSPGSPWLWRKDWAANRAYGNNSKNAIGLAAFAGFWNTIAITASAAALPQYLRTHDVRFLMPFFFVAVGGILTFYAARAGVRRERFGRTYFQFASLPFSPGKPLRGTVHLRLNTKTRHGINLRLSCQRQIVTGGGDNRSTSTVVLWQSDKNVSEQTITPGPTGDAAIPVEFSIPSDAYETNNDQPSDKLLWILHAEADTPGVSFSDDFEVPVFRLTPAEAPSSFGEATGATFSAGFQSDSEDVPPPDNPKVVVGAGANGGTEYYFPPSRNPLRLLGMVLFTGIWTAIVYFLRHSQAPIFFPIIFGLFDLLLIYGLLRSALGSWRIEAGNGKIVLSRAFAGIGTSREIPYSEITQILATTMAVQASQTFYSLRLQTKSGQKITLADAIDNRQEARWVAAQLEKMVGLKLDTHVEVDMGLGRYAPPPQRGMAAPPAGLQNRVALAAGIAVLCAMMGFALFVRNSRTNGPARPHAARRVPQGKSPVQPVSYSALTDTDVQRLQGMTEQAQAEELLERAIRHDNRALELFEQNIGIWLGDIKLTERMKQLEWRSRFSSDLRVRYANADLNLAMDGWSKSDNSVDLLIAKADSDAKYRTGAVYFMGMMAGRGVGYDRIYPVLVEYARNNPDANVRQWAIEGMRYLGTDEALDVLFQSFTQDPSDAVRNRAGCNISDCGNFMRKQRMRMVPKFIELVEDPQTKPVMRNWSFMALREITDESLPSDAAAWRDWYTQHGADKMAEFEQMDWWKVRGDE
jgi:hypothetical protein